MENFCEVEPVLDANGDDSLSEYTDRYGGRFPTETASHLVFGVLPYVSPTCCAWRFHEKDFRSKL